MSSLRNSPLDPVAEGLPLSDGLYRFTMHPATPVVFGLVYVLLVTKANQYQPSRKDHLANRVGKALVLLHNIALTVYSAWTFFSFAPAVFRQLTSALAEHRGEGFFRRALCDVNGDLWEGSIAKLGYLFYLSKYYEVVDTVILLLKGKRAQTLQVYHHCGALLSMYTAIRWKAVPVWLFIFENSFIHTIMYLYYSCATVGLPFPRVLKRSLTTMQIAQFILGMSVATIYLFIQLPSLPGTSVPCSRCVDNTPARIAIGTNLVYLAPLTFLFLQFFSQSYGKPKQKGRKEL